MVLTVFMLFGLILQIAQSEFSSLLYVIFTLFFAGLSVLFIFIFNKYKAPYLIYKLSDTNEEKIHDFYNKIINLKEVKKIWNIIGEKENVDSRHSAGAKSSFDRVIIDAYQFGEIKGLKTNIDIPSIGNILYFLPDVLLYQTEKKIHAISYKDVKLTASVSNFIEEEELPSDGERLSTTWKHVNNDGSPDKRSERTNYQIPVMKYCRINIEDNTILSMKLMTSNYQIGEVFADAFNKYKK